MTVGLVLCVIYVHVCRTYGLPRSFIECELCGHVMTMFEQFRDLRVVALEVKGANYIHKRVSRPLCILKVIGINICAD